MGEILMKRTANIIRSILVWGNFLFWGMLIAAFLLEPEEDMWEAIKFFIIAGTLIYVILFRLIWKKPPSRRKRFPNRKKSADQSQWTPDATTPIVFYGSSDSYGGDSCGTGDGGGGGGGE